MMPIRSLADLANTTPMMSLEAERDEILPPGNDRAHSLFLQLGLALLISHFRGEHLVNQNLLEDYDDRILKRIQRDTVQDAEVRLELATDAKVWDDMCKVIEAAVPTLNKQCFMPKSEGTEDSLDWDTQSCKMIVEHAPSLRKDIPRLRHVVAIGRNILTCGEAPQTLAARSTIDSAIFQLITLCIKATARGFSADVASEDEDVWQKIIEEFKKLLINCLQFINNLIAQNERRKLMLWVELFDRDREGHANSGSNVHDEETESLIAESGSQAELPASKMNWVAPITGDVLTEAEEARLKAAEAASKSITGILSNPFLLYFGTVIIEVRRDLEEQGKPVTAVSIASECRRKWQNETHETKMQWVELFTQMTQRYDADSKEDIKATMFASAMKSAAEWEPTSANLSNIATQLMNFQEKFQELDCTAGTSMLREPPMDFQRFNQDVVNAQPLLAADSKGVLSLSSDLNASVAIDDQDFKMAYTADYGLNVLERGKHDLLRRLEPDSDQARNQYGKGHGHAPQDNTTAGAEASTHFEEERQPVPSAEADTSSVEEEDSDDDSYTVPGDNNRGLLTDIPLILGPAEIEVLPMIIQTAVVAPEDSSKPGYGETLDEILAIRNMHIVRCHLLLAQDYGRNLIRELLIFVAAWDLRENELYFKLMSNIMEAILMNGLMPFSYHAFRESKDIVSPAQAVIMKLLTVIFRRRQARDLNRAAEAPNPKAPVEASPPGPENVPKYPQRVEVTLVNFLFTEFRRNIIPQTCALIFLQGKIRSGVAHPDDFPLNLWDMERMYEGIYQYLEFLAILTEHPAWKNMMSDWGLITELVTLVEELSNAIPRSTLKSQSQKSRLSEVRSKELRQSSAEAMAPLMTMPEQVDQSSIGAEGLPIRTREPPPPLPESPPNIPPPLVPGAQPNALPNAPPILPSVPRIIQPPADVADNYPAGPTEEEPCNFEWRQLKKLAVLVISSLVCGNRDVQKQLAAPGKDKIPGRGIRALLRCCDIDDFNPYIKEHAVMALRFALENNPEGQQLVRDIHGTPIPRDAPEPEPAQTMPPRSQSSQETYVQSGVEIPREVLDLNGYETFTASDGQVLLRKRPATSPT